MTDNKLSIRLFAVVLLTCATIVCGLACGDDDSEKSDTPADQTVSGSGGSGVLGNSGSGSPTPMDSGTGDGNLPAAEPLVPLTGECSVPVMMAANEIKGVCRQSEAECEGGTYAMDLSSLLTMVNVTLPEEMSNMPTNFEDKTANCEEGLICCVNPGQCSTSNISSFLVSYVDAMGCVAADSCVDGFALGFGCSTGQVCCVETSYNGDGGFPFGEGGLPSSVDAGTQP